jgi:hypothetical protein
MAMDPRPRSFGAGAGRGQEGVPPARAAEERESYRGIFYEPPYSIWQAALSFGVIAIGRLLSWWIWGE